MVPVGNHGNLTNGYYHISNSALAAAACATTQLAGSSCANGNVVSTAATSSDAGLQVWQLTFIPGTAYLYDVTLPCERSACNQYLSCGGACGNTLVDIYSMDDGSGRQQWQVLPRCSPTLTVPCSLVHGRLVVSLQ